MQSPGRQSTGNTQVSPPPAVQLTWLVQALPPTEQVPVEHCDEVVHGNPLFAQRDPQSVSRKQLWVEPMHWPGTHCPEAQPELEVHGEPPGSRAAQTGIGRAEVSQKSSVGHCDVDVHGAPAASRGWQIAVPVPVWQ